MVDAERLPIAHTKDDVGIDVGIKTFATLSTGETFDAPKPLRQAKTLAGYVAAQSITTSQE